MKTLWAFGDSFTAEFDTNHAPPFLSYKLEKNRKLKTYPTFISEKLNINVKNFAIGGNDNQTIIETINNNKSYIIDGDIVIIGWAPQMRFRIVKNDKWEIMNGVSKLDGDLCDGISHKTISEILINRMHNKFDEELNVWSEIVTHMFKNNRVINWFWHRDGLFTKFDSIRKDTEGRIEDDHWSENGHKDFANWLIENKL